MTKDPMHKSCMPAPQTNRPGKAYRIAYHKVLNPAQMAAVFHHDGPLLVIAGAGSGKTRTLTYRAARLVEDGIPPEAILLLSFTRKASQEMVQRASALLDDRCRQIAGGTFHSFANRVLRRYATYIGFDKGFSILDRPDSEDLIGLIRKQFGQASTIHQLPRKSTLATMFSRSINKGISLEEVVCEEYPHFEHQLDAIIKIEEIYQKQKREHFFCDYDDLLVYLLRLLKKEKAVQKQLTSTYRYILVDEYQDTNLIQADIIFLLAGSRRNVMVVGDDSQSIYAFRGADFKNIITFPDRFPSAQIIKLEENYRSRQPILDLTNAIIEAADEKYSKRLYTSRQGGNRPILVATADENIQSRYVAGAINRLTGSGVPFNQIAVLFRASFHSFDLELELNRRAITFVKYGGFKLAEAAHVKDLLAHLKIISAPRDRLSWYRVLLMVDRIGPKTAQRIYESTVHAGKDASDIPDTAIGSRDVSAMGPLKEVMAAAATALPSVREAGEMVLDYYLPLLKKRYDDHPRRLRDLQQLMTIMERYDSLDNFLTDMALEPPNTTVQGQLNTVADVNVHRLNLSTVHSAKGLEWHTVFVIWALDGRFPSHYAVDRPEALEEERRLMYVATTRARENLIITYPARAYDRATQSVLYRSSRFLEDMPDHLLERRYVDNYGESTPPPV